MADGFTVQRSGLRSIVSGSAAMVLAGTAGTLLLALASGLPKLAAGGTDNDSLMRLVMVRDLLAGQAWFDPVQYRMGPDGGLAMHWSRLVDAPIALLVTLFGERAASFIWPTALLAAALALVARLAGALGGSASLFPALVLAVVAFHSMGIFQPGSLDHHNLQLVLVLAMTSGLLSRTVRGAAVAGTAGILSLAVGVETLPLVAAGGIAAALPLLLGEPGRRARAAWFGLGFGGVGALALIATQPPGAWWRTTCDAFSGGHAAVAVAAGTGLALAALATGRSGTGTRLAGLALAGALTAGAALIVMPACLGDPYASLDPRLRTYWLDWVIEAQPIWSMITHDPVQAALHYATPLVALAVLAFAGGAGDRARRFVLILMLATAAAVSWWQLRGAIFALALAIPPLAAWIGVARQRAQSGDRAASLRLVAAWLLSFNVAWGLAAQAVMPSGRTASPAGMAANDAGDACVSEQDHAALAAEPRTTVLAISNLGAPILAWTPHRALAGPYHRNEAGNLAVLEAMLGDAAEAGEIARAHGVGLLAFCPGNQETRVLAGRAPDGLAADLLAGRTPEWLEPLPGTAALRLFRVHGAIAP